MHNYDRRKTAYTLPDAFEEDADSAIDSLKKSIVVLRRYNRVCSALPAVFRKLAEALETKAIGVQADRIESRLQSILGLTAILSRGVAVTSQFEKEFDQMIEKMAKNMWRGPANVVEAVQGLPTAVNLYKTGTELEDMAGALVSEDDDSPIEWTLEDYLGSEAKIGQRLEKVAPPVIADVISDNPLFNVLKYYSDPDFIETRISDLKD